MSNIQLIYYHANYDCLPSANATELSFPVSLYFARDTSVRKLLFSYNEWHVPSSEAENMKAMEVVLGV
jgi:hypothetical protein